MGDVVVVVRAELSAEAGDEDHGHDEADPAEGAEELREAVPEVAIFGEKVDVQSGAR